MQRQTNTDYENGTGLSTKKARVNDLAKEAGITGKELLEKLHSWGFNDIKSAQSALEFDMELRVRGLMEARGVMKVGGGAAPEASSAAGELGGLIKKKKKKLSLDGGADEAVAETEAPAAAQPAAIAEAPAVEAPKKPAIEAVEAEAEPAPARIQPVEAQKPAPRAAPLVEPEVEAVAPEPVAQREERRPEPTIAPEAKPEERVAQPAAAAVVEPAPVAEVLPATPLAAPSTEPKVAPRAGKVVGFVDLSKLKPQTPAKKPTESRRLRGKDEVTPDVKPTMPHDKKRALGRGTPVARGQMSASQLRTQASDRFLRRNQIAAQGAERTARGGGGRQAGRGDSSPFSGQKVEIDAPVTIKKLADKLAIKSNELLKVAFGQMGFGAVNINSLLDEDTAVLLAGEFEVELVVVQEVEAETELLGEIKQKRTAIAGDDLAPRAPTVAILGHVDHGKTTLIDAIRSSNVAGGEAGGITQHIGAYSVQTKAGHQLTIIDTPGHSAFTQMRARGAKAVDIVVLVVAADDGPMPSTEEALAHARAAKVPVVVALTKTDKPEANLQRAKESLTKLGLVPEEWGGETAMMGVSALKNQGVDELLERVFLETEVLELRCHPKGPAQGVVLEAEISEGKGIVAHLLVQDGTLKRGDVILAGEGYGKVRSIHDDRGRVIDSAGPATPIEVSGLSSLPGIGETFYVVEDLARAKEVAEERERKNRAMSLTERRQVTAENLLKAVADSKKRVINVIVRADVQGSVEVLKSSLSELKHDEVEVKVVFAGVGAVTENDVILAQTSNAIVVAFHTTVNDKARAASDRSGIDIRYYEVIYELLDHMRDLMEGTLAPEISEQVVGHVEVRALFKSSKVGTIAGSHVIDGTVTRDSKVRVMRGGKQIFEGVLASLRREKDDVKEVRSGFDCGLTVRDFPDVEVGDIVEAYKMVTSKRTLGDKAGV
ncbi:MAG: translation initiation factor [Planctomycetota bacterium]